MNNSLLKFRNIEKQDCERISKAFKAQGWHKEMEQYEEYLKEENEGTREVIIGELNNEFVGYVTIQWRSEYAPFRDNNIPEIKDFNVLIKYRGRGIGTALMDEAEKRASLRSNIIGIGVGLMSDYGAAQRLYVKRGYIPDGRGLFKNGKFLGYGDEVRVDDDLNMFFTKSLEDI